MVDFYWKIIIVVYVNYKFIMWIIKLLGYNFMCGCDDLYMNYLSI